MSNFSELGLSSPVERAVTAMGFEEMTPIQSRAIPLFLQGKDFIGQAQTGTGKTAAFGIPIAEKLRPDMEHVAALVVTPTRELAIQVAEELNRIGQYKRIRALPIYGGQDIERQIRALKNRPQIVVGTPGRLMDHMRRQTLRLQWIEIVVLDEADEMLSMGFVEDIETILSEVPDERQTMLFSATIPRAVQELSRRFMREPQYITIQPKEVTVPNTEQQYIELPEKLKFDALCRLLDIQSPEAAIVFGRTKRRVGELYEALSKRGYSAEGIHGDLAQTRRDSVMRRFRSGNVDILVATDVAARGLDISGVTHVYNFDVPQDPESYVHRIGRTGRAGKSGLAITFVTPREMGHLRLIETITNKKMKRRPLPSMADALQGQLRLTSDRLLETVEAEQYYDYQPLAEELLERADSVTLLAAALKLMTKEPDATPVTLTEEAPLRDKRARPSSFGGRRPGYGPRRTERSDASGQRRDQGYRPQRKK
ncbi:MAG: DEAD/DEAH box helicase [Gracilibacteraceae bacterium]|nr:DEAD/DEAH box helicase [Gracilibacteraceae bacterium]